MGGRQVAPSHKAGRNGKKQINSRIEKQLCKKAKGATFPRWHHVPTLSRNSGKLLFSKEFDIYAHERGCTNAPAARSLRSPPCRKPVPGLLPEASAGPGLPATDPSLLPCGCEQPALAPGGRWGGLSISSWVQTPRKVQGAGSVLGSPACSQRFGGGEVPGVLWIISAGAGLGTGPRQPPKEAGAGARRGRGCVINGDDSVGKWDSSSFISLKHESEAADGKGRKSRAGRSQASGAVAGGTAG